MCFLGTKWLQDRMEQKPQSTNVSFNVLYKMDFVIPIKTSSFSNKVRGFTSHVIDIIAVSESASHTQLTGLQRTPHVYWHVIKTTKKSDFRRNYNACSILKDDKQWGGCVFFLQESRRKATWHFVALTFRSSVSLMSEFKIGCSRGRKRITKKIEVKSE